MVGIVIRTPRLLVRATDTTASIQGQDAVACERLSVHYLLSPCQTLTGWISWALAAHPEVPHSENQESYNASPCTWAPFGEGEHGAHADVPSAEQSDARDVSCSEDSRELIGRMGHFRG